MTNCKCYLATVLTVYLTTILCACSSLAQSPEGKGYTAYKIDQRFTSLIEKAKSESDFNIKGMDNAFWFFIQKDDLKEFGVTDPALFFDTIQTFMMVPCDCMTKKDTVFVQGGIGYGGGLVFDLRIVKDLFNGKILLYGKGYRTDTTAAFKKEIWLNNIKQTLSIDNKNALKPGKNIKGMLFLETEDYYIEEEPAPTRFYMKLLFDCKLDEHIAF